MITDRLLKYNIFSFLSDKLYIFILIFFVLLAFRNPAAAENNNSEKKSRFDWFWLFYENDVDQLSSSFTIRPFYLRNTEKDKSFQASLMPVVFWKYEDPRKEKWKSFFGLINSIDYMHGDGIRDYDFGMFPFFLYGNSVEKKDRYMHVWPIGGIIKGKLAQDYVKTYAFPGVLLFLLFPPSYPVSLTTAAIFLVSLMPLYAEYGYNGYKAKAVLWPLFQRGKSPVRDDLRILPFYSHFYKENSYNNYSFLMVFHYQRKLLKNDEEKTLFIFPLYGRRWNQQQTRGSATLLWPFFSWGFDDKRGDSDINFPWPFIQIRTCEDPYVRKRIFFPVCGTYEFKNSRTSFITPFHFRLVRNTENFISDYHINFFIFWLFKRDFNKKPDPVYGRKWRYFKIWPLLQYEYDDRDNLSVNMLSLFPFRDKDGYEKMYQPFWTLFEYERKESGERRLGLLLRLYYQQWGNEFIRIKIPFVLSYGSSRENANRLTFLDYFSVFCYNNDENGKYIGFLFSMFGFSSGEKKYVRIFWIPVSLGSSEENAAENINKDDYYITEYKDRSLLIDPVDPAYKNNTVSFSLKI